MEHRYVACKLHGLNAQWSEDKKQSYIRHAIREYNIHKTLVHHHIVRLWDIFEIDSNTFCTVLEYCSGKHSKPYHILKLYWIRRTSETFLETTVDFAEYVTDT